MIRFPAFGLDLDAAHYGHLDALRTYCGVSARWQPCGRLQHGWSTGPGLPESEWARPYRKFVWGDRNLVACRRLGHHGAVAVGAPFLYLPEAPAPECRGSGLLAMPFHGWEKQQLIGSMEEYARSLLALSADGFEPITVCLHWAEHSAPENREVFTSKGFSVVTNGPRDGNPGFMLRLRGLLDAHRYVTSNRVSSAGFYALSRGRRFFLHGPPMSLAHVPDATGDGFARWQREEFPELHYDAGWDLDWEELGTRELGKQYLRSPKELRRLFHWGFRQMPLYAMEQLRLKALAWVGS